VRGVLHCKTSALLIATCVVGVGHAVAKMPEGSSGPCPSGVLNSLLWASAAGAGAAVCTALLLTRRALRSQRRRLGTLATAGLFGLLAAGLPPLLYLALPGARPLAESFTGGLVLMAVSLLGPPMAVVVSVRLLTRASP
jgi:hypothetical protein